MTPTLLSPAASARRDSRISPSRLVADRVRCAPERLGEQARKPEWPTRQNASALGRLGSVAGRTLPTREGPSPPSAQPARDTSSSACPGFSCSTAHASGMPEVSAAASIHISLDGARSIRARSRRREPGWRLGKWWSMTARDLIRRKRSSRSNRTSGPKRRAEEVTRPHAVTTQMSSDGHSMRTHIQSTSGMRSRDGV